MLFSEIHLGIAAGRLLRLSRPLFSASATHSSVYPFPLNTTFLCSERSFFNSSWIMESSSSADTSLSASYILSSASATAVFKTIFAFATEPAEPGIRNSNLFPVNAKGDVRFLSVVSFVMWGRTSAPISIWVLPLPLNALSSSRDSRTSSSSSPTNIEMIAGGASFAPSL